MAILKAATLTAALAAVTTAFSLAWIKADTRRLEASVNAQERAVERLRDNVSVLRAEASYLARPEQIDRLARERLGLGAATPEQAIRVEDLDRHLPSATGTTPLRKRAP